MTQKDEWESATWAGNRLQQHREFQALPFREKMLRLEQLAKTAALLRTSQRVEPPVTERRAAPDER